MQLHLLMFVVGTDEAHRCWVSSLPNHRARSFSCTNCLWRKISIIFCCTSALLHFPSPSTLELTVTSRARAIASQNGEPRLKACRRPRRDTGPYCPAAVVIYSFCFCSRSNKHNAYDTTSILRCLPPSLRLSCCLASPPPYPRPPPPHACTQSLSRSNKHLHLPHILTNISGKHRA